MYSLESQFPTRLVTLSTGRSGLREQLHVRVRPPAAQIENQKSKIENSQNPTLTNSLTH